MFTSKVSRVFPSLKNSVRIRCSSSTTTTTTTTDLFSKDAITNCFKAESFQSIARGWFVYSLIRFEIIVKNADLILKWARRLLGERAIRWALRKTIYSQFVAGEEKREVVERIKKIKDKNILVFLSYAAEQHSQQEFDKMKKCTLDCIDIVVDSSEPGDRIVAIKVSPLAPLALLKKMNSVIRAKQRLFLQLSEQANNQQQPNALMLQSFHQNIKKIDASLTTATIEELFKQTSCGLGKITIRRWQENLKEGGDLYKLLKRKSCGLEELSIKENLELAQLMDRIGEIGIACESKGVRLLVDAEQTYIQNFIHYVAVQFLMKRFNTNKCIVYNTFQCKLRNTESELRIDIDYAKEENIIYGLKMVRGAYLEEERRLARELGYPDPTNPSLEATTDMYNRVMDLSLREVKRDRMRLMVATHNTDSVRRAVREMELLGIPKRDGVVFGQLLGKQTTVNRVINLINLNSIGMCDFVSSTLADAGYIIHKSVPYGPVMEVVPYLIRRAQENTHAVKRADLERKVLGREIRNRLFT